jgi:hypothetical protein
MSKGNGLVNVRFVPNAAAPDNIIIIVVDIRLKAAPAGGTSCLEAAQEPKLEADPAGRT